jgi:hypothetical protein
MWGDWRAQDSWAELETGGGICGQTMLATPFGMRPAQALRIGDYLRTVSGGPVAVVSIRPAPNQGWMRIPPLALCNRHALVVGQGQSLLIESSFLHKAVGSAAVVVPAAALRHWRGIALCLAPAQALRLTAARPALIVGSTGVLLAVNGPANAALAQDDLPPKDLPPVPSLSLASARQLIACLIAYEAGAMLRGVGP